MLSLFAICFFSHLFIYGIVCFISVYTTLGMTNLLLTYNTTLFILYPKLFWLWPFTNLFQVVSNVPVTCSHPFIFLKHFLKSGSVRCSRFILYFLCPRVRLLVSQFLKEPWLLWLEDGILTQDLSVGKAMWFL